MTTALGDRWDRPWQIHEDLNGILDGVKDLRFTLRRISADGGPGAKYAFDHTFDEESGLELDPFKDTVFTLYGKGLPIAPSRKLKSWKTSERDRYKTLIAQKFGNPSSNFEHLIGEKIFNEEPESLVLVLLPQAIDFFDNGTRIVDLIYMACSTRLRIQTSKLPGRRRRILQDGTAHGNPR